MEYFESIFLWAAIACYSLAFLSFLTHLVFKKERFSNIGFYLTVIGGILHTAAIIDRWVGTGHFPVMATYENSLTGAWFIVMIYIFMRIFFPSSKLFGVAILPLAVLILGNGIQTGGVLEPLEPPYRSKWLYVHVLFAWFAFSSYVIAFATGIMYLLKGKAKEGFLTRLPALQILDELSLRLILFGFFSEAIMIASGAIWAKGLWGRYWGWDPVETWSLVSWLTYGLNIHLRVTMGWKGKRAAWLTIISLFGVIFLFFGIGFVSGIHTGIF